MRIGRTIVASIVSALIGTGGMYLYTRGNIERSEESSRLVAKFEELNKQYQQLEKEKAEWQAGTRDCASHKQQEGVFYAEALRQNVEIRNLERRILVLASKHNDAQEVQGVLAQNRDLAHELSSELFRENWLHVLARSDKAGISDVAKVFIDFGVDREARNTEGKRPIDIARSYGTGEVIDVLQRYQPKDPVRVSLN